MTFSNAQKYRFSDFTLEMYALYIRKAKAKFRFVEYSAIDQTKNDEIYWRHDVDFSIDGALNLARIEEGQGVKSTFFFLIHGQFYNLYEKRNLNIVKEILEMGHKVGLHYDSHFHNIQVEENLESSLVEEKNLLEKLIKCNVDVFSFHNTTSFTMSCKRWKLGGMINTYAEYFQKKCGYCSDSNGYWRFETLGNVLDAEPIKSLQVLTHPVWWSEQVSSPRNKVFSCIGENSKRLKSDYDKFLFENKRENIDW